MLWLSAALLVVCALTSFVAAQAPSAIEPGPEPHDIPAQWKAWIGEYGTASHGPTETVYVLSEKDGAVLLSERRDQSENAKYELLDQFPLSRASPRARHKDFQLQLDSAGKRVLRIAGAEDVKITPDFAAKAQVLIKPVRPVSEIRPEALAASPPHEEGTFRKPELVELAPLDPAIHLDIRYATSNDFLGTPVYTQARAFMQRPAAESLVRALHKLKALGYGLLIHDAYRPWYVTKIFWDATPPEGKIFVADPSQGSRHNRGCAVDLTLYDLASGKPIEMPGTYDEMSPRSFPDYPGGTSLERWHRDLLRRAMESEGFTVYEHEWWHFDYKDWRQYPILNIKFEDLSSSRGLASAN